MTTYTNVEIRGAILRAADRIERLPSSYDFDAMYVPADYGGCGCLWGWIGYELGMLPGTCNYAVAEACGIVGTAHLYAFGTKTKHRFSLASMFGQSVASSAAAEVLRAYADKYFPAEVAAPANDCRALVRWEDCVWRPAQVRA